MAAPHSLRAALRSLWAVICVLALLGWPPHLMDAQQSGPDLQVTRFGGLEETVAIALGDLNGDGLLDILAGNQAGLDPDPRLRQNYIYLNPGPGAAGTWTAAAWKAVAIGGSEDTRSVALGDLNGDGRLDVVAGNEGQSFLYLSQGAQGWSETPLGEPRSTRSVALGDLNGDGRLDIVTGNWGQSDEVYLNRGGGLFFRASGFDPAPALYTSSVALGDLDRDGDLDVVALNWNQPNAVYFNDGRGNLERRNTFGGANLATSVAVAELSGDGLLDLVVGNRGQNYIYLNNGQGHYSSDWVVPLGDEDRTQSVAVADLNGDGLLDILVGNRDQPNVVYLNEGRFGASPAQGQERLPGVLGRSTVQNVQRSSTAFGGQDWTESIAAGDLNGDGLLDIVAGNSKGQSSIYTNRGAGDSPTPLAPGLPFGIAAQTRSVAVGDLDGDGRLDVLAGNRGRNAIHYNDGPDEGHGLVHSVSFGSDLTESVALGDMNGDGALDIVAGNQGRNVLYLNDRPRLIPSGYAFGKARLTHSVALGDLDQDGDLDVVAGNDLENQVYLNDGQGGLTGFALGPKPEGALATLSVALGDLNGDGLLDIVAGNQGRDQVYLNAGQGTFLPGSEFGGGTTRAVAVGDLDGDGWLDVVAASDPKSYVYLNDGAGRLQGGLSFGENQQIDALALGDWDGDGDLDLVAGHWGAQNRVYLNDGSGHLSAHLAFGGADEAHSVALGDLDGDGSLDIVTGIHGHQNSVHWNPTRRATGLVDHPATPHLLRPGPTANAGFYSSPAVLTGSTLEIPYTLADPEGDPVRFVRLLYSPNGGGQWFPATAASGTVTTNLSTGAGAHLYTWQVDADLVRSDNVVLRIEAYPSLAGPGPFQWPYVAAQSYPFRVATPWYAKVVDGEGQPLAGATLYAGGVPVTHPASGASTTDAAGLLGLAPLPAGTRLAALAPVFEKATSRAYHDGWAYRVYLTSQEEIRVTGPGEQRLVMRRSQPLILFNLLASIEWNADQAYVAQIADAMRAASDSVYDLTDGQMALGSVAIYDGAEHWSNADLQISAKNVVRPHAYIGGLTSDDHSHVIRVGRFWNRYGGSAGPWDEPDGYRTLAHEFGHYALQLYDEYFDYRVDAQGSVIGETEAWCTGPENRAPGTEATNASVMDWQYSASELSARGVPGLWSTLCEHTAQWRFNGESAWETLRRVYGDGGPAPRWSFTTPLERGQLLRGPEALRDDLPAWPQIELHVGAPAPVRTLHVRDASGPLQGALVALYTNQGGHPVAIDQGFTSADGTIEVYGALPGDTLRAATFDGALSGAVSVGEATDYDLTLVPAAGLRALALPERYPQLTLRPSSRGDELYLRLSGLGPGGQLAAIVAHTESGASGGASQATALSYSSSIGGYTGTVQLAASGTLVGTGSAQVIGMAGNGQGISLSSSFAVQALPRTGVSDLHSADGNLHLHAVTGTLPVDAYLVLSASNAVPAPLPAGQQIVGNAYDVRFSGAQILLDQAALLRMHYDCSLLERGGLQLGLYHWDPHAEAWIRLAGRMGVQLCATVEDEEQRFLSAPIRAGGTYALLASPIAWTDTIYLPVVIR